MKKISYIIFTGTILSSFFGFSQDTLAISKSELVQKVSEKNLQIKIAEKTYQSARADYNQSNALFLPNINVSHTGISTTNPLMAFGSKLNQEILTASDFNPALLNDPAKTQNFATKFEIQQPLINIDGLFERKAAKSKMEAYQLQTERTKEYLELEVSKAYMQLQLAYRAVKVLEKANATGKANLKLVDNYFKQGMLQKTDLLNVQVRVNEIANQLQYAKSNVQNASDYLAFLLNEDSNGKIYKPSEELDNAIVIEEINTSLSDNRKDIQAMSKSSEAYAKMLQSSKMAFLPRLNAFGSYELYDKNFLGTAAKGYLVGAQLSWNVFDGYKSIGKFQKAKAEFQKADVEKDQYKKQSQLELNKTNRQLKDAENKVNLSQLALEQSQEAYRIRQNRFTQGLEKTTDLLQSETQMIQKELEHLQSVFEYNFTKQYLQFLTK
ncbi:TolC family protein [Flavobacterium aquatile]|uniref:Transporter n=1 Tax=Flavobacterium aquatile LMG 4008 = ATCC 11947 TaxID=1453498 RepID=A0A095SR63_9FLAO|nr:TolC family protein [Flavobacterium aquatile]KGD66854.1 transporter [Flavobacterium aquatile LMG 4008 = ATCC 11947]OXA67947.1 transporter [Flavobacterium aquatile] [Flavobacterium aquatile LMG 4008 = ATCC 11947]GEC78640.1 transporter [Flavobacterium aquatile]